MLKIELMLPYFYLLSVLFVSIGAVTIVAPSQAQRANHNYIQIMNQATSAIDACYKDKNLEECAHANRIKNTLKNWCIQSNNTKSRACTTYANVLIIQDASQSLQRYRESPSIR